MARLVPPVLGPGCKSRGEREVFRRLQEAPAGWTVLHSLDVAVHQTRLAGEIDFVAIVPSKGILCLEVKGCSQLRRSSGLWFYGSDPRPDSRGPFKQAADGMHALRRQLHSQAAELSGVPFWSAVVFPYVDFTALSGEWEAWQVIDAGAFRASPLHCLLENILDNARERLAQRGVPWFSPGSREPSPVQCDAAVRLLRPDFEFYMSPRSFAESQDLEVKRYTSEQFLALDSMESNQRVAFAGPAGTGKTMLAVEATRRAHAAGRRSLFLCFNQLLGRWLKSEAAGLYPHVAVKTLHRHLLDLAGLEVPEAGAGPGFWEAELPARAVDRILRSGGEDDLFDELVLDEAQDLLRPSYLDALDLSLRGGLASGRWRLFGDFERQEIYKRADSLGLAEFLRNRGGSAPVFSLRTNCRNTPRIAALVRLVGGLDPDYAKVLRPDNGLEPAIHFYCNIEEQAAALGRSLEALHKEGLAWNEITILSFRADRSSAAAYLAASGWPGGLRPISSDDETGPGYGSVHSFKGLEAPAVIVTDIDRFADAAAENLLYVAISRALHRIVLLVAEGVRPALVRALFDEGTNGGKGGTADGYQHR